ncbi:unnamed protein product [Ambrosiozyma monospora]|uniref:Unnamed protein product n=1 Tax=Ambrosiozyma monospora TaxID=43982 RepID=A0A9W6YXB7_AMBMO|nr:unnamed protein product [Ambrosiozyma monospora]
MDAAMQAARAIAVAEEAARSAYQTLQQTSAQWASNSTSESSDKSNQNQSSEGSSGNNTGVNNENGKFDLELEFVGYPPSTSSGNSESNTVPITNLNSVPLTKDIGSGSKRPIARNRRNNISTIINDSDRRLLPRHPPPPKPVLLEEPPLDISQMETSVCSRCKKVFPQTGPKPFKLCAHCRELQRQRSRRWQNKTKQKTGACRRCGVKMTLENSEFVLCEHCRMSLRSRKANRAAHGRCVHCSGPKEDDDRFKVCLRCRQNDKIRRTNLEKLGACNRCAQPLIDQDQGHKVCGKCRSKKKTKDEFTDSLSSSEMDADNFDYPRKKMKKDAVNTSPLPRLHLPYVSSSLPQQPNPSTESQETTSSTTLPSHPPAPPLPPSNLYTNFLPFPTESSYTTGSTTGGSQQFRSSSPSANKVSVDSSPETRKHYIDNKISSSNRQQLHVVDQSVDAVGAAAAALLLPDFDNDQQLAHIHHAQLDQHLTQQLHGQLNELAANMKEDDSTNVDEEDTGSLNGNDDDRQSDSDADGNDESLGPADVGGSLTIPDPDKICIHCGQSIHIDDLSINPATNTCSKCYDTLHSRDDDNDANLFMNADTEDEIKKR